MRLHKRSRLGLLNKDELVLAAGLVCSIRQTVRRRRDQDACMLEQHLKLCGSTSGDKDWCLERHKLDRLVHLPRLVLVDAAGAAARLLWPPFALVPAACWPTPPA